MGKSLLTALMLIICAAALQAKFEFAGEIKSFKAEEGRVEFVLSNALLNVYIIDSNIVRFRYTNRDRFSPAPSYAVVYKSAHAGKIDMREEAGKFLISTGELIIEIKKDPCRITVYDKAMNLLNADDDSFGVSFDEGEIRCHKKLFTDERFFGLGEKADDRLVKNGSQYIMWNTDYYAYTSRQDPLYVSIPFFIGMRNHKAYGIFLDNTYKSCFNMGASSDRYYWFGAEKGELDYYFINGPDMRRVISGYTKLTGRMELPPVWALGYQQSRWSYYPESTVRSIAKSFREKNIPCDVIYLDIHYMDGYRVFTWDKNRFPDPEKLLGDLKNEGFKIIPIIDPGVKADENYFAAKEGIEKDLFAKYPDGKLYRGEVWPGWSYFPDFTKSETRAWWGEKIAGLLNTGVAGIWNDMNEPSVWGQAFPDIVQFDDNGFKSDHKKIHNVFALEMAHATRDGFKKYSRERHFLLSRAGYAGIQRYSANWTGDNVSSEEHLRLACTMPLNIGLSGQPFIGSDIGGFMGGEPTNEMYIRWLQIGSFSPFFRGHSAIETKAREPFAFNEETQNIARKVIQLRYKLLPFWYNEFYNSTQTGLPVMQPLFLNFQDDENCYSAESQYQFTIGENLLVAPVVVSTDKTKKLYLPKGKWYDWMNNRTVNGGEWKIIEVPLDMTPLFIREGGMIPMQEVQNYTDEKEIKQLELVIFPAGKSNYTLYEDDGRTYRYSSGEYNLTEFKCESDDSAIKLTVQRTKSGFQNRRTSYLFTFLNTVMPKRIKINDKEPDPVSVKYDDSRNALLIGIPDTGAISIVLEK